MSSSLTPKRSKAHLERGQGVGDAGGDAAVQARIRPLLQGRPPQQVGHRHWVAHQNTNLHRVTAVIDSLQMWSINAAGCALL